VCALWVQRSLRRTRVSSALRHGLWCLLEERNQKDGLDGSPYARCARAYRSELNTQQREARPNGVGGISLRTDGPAPWGTRPGTPVSPVYPAQ